jgi:peptide chain release factor 3
VNKLDREVREPLELLAEIESVLKIDCAPVTWPLGMGKPSAACSPAAATADALHAGRGARSDDAEIIEGLDNPKLDELFPTGDRPLRDDVELIAGRAALRPRRLPRRPAEPGVLRLRHQQLRRAGDPAGAGRLGAAAAAARRRRAHGAAGRSPFTGFVFKIQANMDPRHRDRIAFFRVCSGRYAPGMKVRHLRAGREMKLGQRADLHGQRARAMEDAVAGDIIGIHNHGQLQIGDTLTEGEALGFKGIPYFAPETVPRARPRDPLKSKQLEKGLQELGEEGAIQVFELESARPAARRGRRAAVRDRRPAPATEYKVDALYEPPTSHTARWLTYPDDLTRRDFEREQAAALAKDVDGNPVYPRHQPYNLQVTMERWPKVGFHATREHGQRECTRPKAGDKESRTGRPRRAAHRFCRPGLPAGRSRMGGPAAIGYCIADSRRPR